jgi:hypothetical protein
MAKHIFYNICKFILGFYIFLGSGCGETPEHIDWDPHGVITFNQNVLTGIRICAEQHDYAECTLSESDGNYYLHVDDAIRHEEYEVCAFDIDSEDGGGSFKKSCKIVSPYTTEPELNFSLEKLVQ